MAFAHLRCGVIFINAANKVIQLNPVAQQILGSDDGLCIRGDRLRANVRDEDESLARLLNAALGRVEHGMGKIGGSMSITRPSGARSVAVLVVPLPEEAIEAGSTRPEAVVFISDPEQRHEVPARVLEQLYGLTRREAALASILVQGVDLKDAAAQLGIREITARSYLKSIFGKTGTHRQTELVRLILTGPAGFLAP